MTTTPLAALQQHCASALEPGEEFLAAIHVQAMQYDKASRDALFGITAGLVMAYRDQKHAQQTTEIPIKLGAFIGVTEGRILVFNAGVGLHPKELLGAVDRAGVTLKTQEFRQNLVKHAHFGLFDGDRAILDAMCSAKNPDLESIRSLLPAAVPA